jgi:hypothetical protein
MLDRRDPQKLGELLFERRRLEPDTPMSTLADGWFVRDAPDYDPTRLSTEPERDPIRCDGSSTCPAYVHKTGCPGADKED